MTASDRQSPPPPEDAPETCRVSMIVDREVAQLFRGVLCSVRRLLDRVRQRPATPGEALGWISAHVLEAWGAQDPRLRREHRVFARDGWRCAVPGCSKMRSLHALGFELGIREGRAPLAVYASGDRRLAM